MSRLELECTVAVYGSLSDHAPELYAMSRASQLAQGKAILHAKDGAVMPRDLSEVYLAQIREDGVERFGPFVVSNVIGHGKHERC